VLGSAALASWWPLASAVAIFALLSARSGWKCRWKSKNALTLALYGVHSHIQQIPIFLGQRRHERDRRAGRRAGLIEYKGSAQ
jgi:hypothetical protein